MSGPISNPILNTISVSEKDLAKLILTDSKKSFKAKKDNNDKLLNNIANNGLNINEIASRTTLGEYSGFTIQALEIIKPLLTDVRVSKIINLLSKSNIKSAINVLNIKNCNVGTLYEILRIWLDKNDLPIPNEYLTKASKIDDPKIIKWITHTRSEPLLGKFKIIGIGKTKKGNTVVPESWTNKKFNDGYELHQEMDKLPNRKGMPPVHYCCIYSMMIKKMESWHKINDISSDYVPDIVVFLDSHSNNINNNINKNTNKNNDKFKTNVYEFKNNIDYINFKNKLNNDKNDDKNNYDIFPYIGPNFKKIAFICDLTMFDKINKEYVKTDNVGVLVSRLQKSIRRGRKCSKLLYETLKKLSKSPPYNIPDQQFVRVSGCKQLCWRLFITIIEDGEPYESDVNQRYYDLLDIYCLALLAQIDPNIQFNDKIIEKLIYTALLVQNNDLYGSNWNWRNGKIIDDYSINNTHDADDTNDANNKNDTSNTSDFNNSIVLALNCSRMMKNDKKMLTKSLDYYNKEYYEKIKKLNVKLNIDKLLEFNEKDIYDKALLASYDNHCMPNIIIYLQASLPFSIIHNSNNSNNSNNVNISTKKLSNFIWDYSSGYNIRNKNKIDKIKKNQKSILKSLIEIQTYVNKKINVKKINYKPEQYDYSFIKDNVNHNQNNIPINISRLAFLLIFGQKVIIFKNKDGPSIEIIVSGDVNKPCKIKKPNSKTSYLENKARYDGEIRYVKHLENNNIVINIPKPPEGYKWIWNDHKVNISAKIIKNYKKEFKNDIVFFANGVEVKPFDGSKFIKKIRKINEIEKIDDELKKYICQALYFDDNLNKSGNGEWELNLTMRKISELRREYNDKKIFKWDDLNNISENVWRSVLAKMYNGFKNEVQIGPVDRNGKKIHESISYNHEGTIYRMYNMLSMIYPFCVVPKTSLKFKINKNTPEFIIMKNTIERLSGLCQLSKPIKQVKSLTKIKTKLWDHQKKTSNDIFNDIINYNKRGFGDASNVGSGKTLTALAVMSKIFNYTNNKSDNNSSNGDKSNGFLILLPTTTLYKTWIDEINKHTQGFHIVEQNSNGTLTDQIKDNSIVITTLGRARDHPFSQIWKFIIIDECLSVQNRDALQTEEAFRQIICSKYGVLMMSATFFRSRFDKLFYMLKMLNTGIPENKKYLDTILSESIICNIPNKSRKWITKIKKFKLSKKLRIEYDNILKKNMSSENLYNALAKLLYDKHNYVKTFSNIIKEINNETNKKALIYAKSKKEADDIANAVNNVSRYPDKKKKHVVVSYAEGSYGLNDLVGYNCIITRVPEPNLVPQMKGRLDRKGQKDDVLEITYLLLENTIEEAWLLRMEIANGFYNNHIMPLATFYDIAVGKKNINDL